MHIYSYIHEQWRTNTRHQCPRCRSTREHAASSVSRLICTCIQIYIYIHVCIYIYIYVYIYHDIHTWAVTHKCKASMPAVPIYKRACCIERVSTHIYIYACIHVYMYTYIQIYIYISVCTYIYICIHLYMHIHTWALTHKYKASMPAVPIYKRARCIECVSTHIHVHVCIYANIHIHTCIYMYVYIYLCYIYIHEQWHTNTRHECPRCRSTREHVASSVSRLIYIYMYTCIHISKHTYTYLYVHMYTYLFLYTYTYMSTDAQMQGVNARGADLQESTLHRVCLDLYKYACIHVCIYANIHMHICIYMYIYMYSYICIHTWAVTHKCKVSMPAVPIYKRARCIGCVSTHPVLCRLKWSAPRGNW